MLSISNIFIANFNPENPGIGTPKSRDVGIGKRPADLGISGSRDHEINSHVKWHGSLSWHREANSNT